MKRKRVQSTIKTKKAMSEKKAKGYAIFSKILASKKAIQRSIKEGRPISKIKGVTIAKPL